MFKVIAEEIFDKDSLWPIIFWVFVLLLPICFVAGYLSGKEQRDWQAYARQHHCNFIGTRTAAKTLGWGVNDKGQMVMLSVDTEAQTGYLCDDNITYWRNEK